MSTTLESLGQLLANDTSILQRLTGSRPEGGFGQHMADAGADETGDTSGDTGASSYGQGQPLGISSPGESLVPPNVNWTSTASSQAPASLSAAATQNPPSTGGATSAANGAGGISASSSTSAPPAGSPPLTGNYKADAAALSKLCQDEPNNKAAISYVATEVNIEAQNAYKANPNNTQAEAVTESASDILSSLQNGSFSAQNSASAVGNALKGQCPSGDNINSCMGDPDALRAKNQVFQALTKEFGNNIPSATNDVNMPDASIYGQIDNMVGTAKSQGKDASISFQTGSDGTSTISIGGQTAGTFGNNPPSLTVNNQQNKGSAGNILADIGQAVEAPFKAIGSVFQGIGKGIGDLFDGHASSALGDVAGGFTGGVKDVTDAATNLGSDVASDIPVVGKALSSNISAVGSGIDNIENGWAKGANALGHGQLGQAVGDVAGGFKSAATGVANSLIDTPTNIVGQIPGLNKTGFATALDTGTNWLSGKADGLINSGVNLVADPVEDAGQGVTDLGEGNLSGAAHEFGQAGIQGAELGVAVGAGIATGGVADAGLAGLGVAGNLAAGDLGGAAMSGLESAGGGLLSSLGGAGGDAAEGAAAEDANASGGLLGNAKNMWDSTQTFRDVASQSYHADSAGQNTGNLVDPNQQQQTEDV